MTVALRHANAGMHVFPLWPRSKIPRLHGRDDCPGTGACAEEHQGWEQRATRDPRLIHRWWSHGPYGVAVATGPSNLYVLDLDLSHGETAPAPWHGARHGQDVLAQLAARAGQPLPEDTYRVRTPSGGQHWYYTVPPTSTLRNTVARAGWRIDSRGRGGYIVAAGSTHRTGIYTVIRAGPIAGLPDWLVPQFTPCYPTPRPRPVGTTQRLPDRRADAYLRKVADGVRHAPPRTAHDVLRRAANTMGRLVAGGDFDDGIVRAALYRAAEDRHIPHREADRTINDGMTWGYRLQRNLAS